MLQYRISLCETHIPSSSGHFNFTSVSKSPLISLPSDGWLVINCNFCTLPKVFNLKIALFREIINETKTALLMDIIQVGLI